MSVSSTSKPADATATVRSLHEAFIRAAHGCDAKAAQALYADDVTIVWEYDGDEANGRAEIDRLITTAFANMTELRLTLEDVAAKTPADGVLTSVGHWKVAYAAPDGTPIVLKLRSTEVVARRKGGWQYVVQHVSAGLPAEPAK
jgi:ketosteroid isomerase-like protein